MLNHAGSRFGKHFCSIHRDKAEQLSTVIPYLNSGLRNQDKCIYIYDKIEPDEIINSLDSSLIDVRDCLKKKQLVFLSKEETYLSEGYFSGLRMLELIQDAHYEALKSGFPGLRGTGEMSWYTQDVSDSRQLIDYESKLNSIVPKYRLTLLCQYDESKFPEEVLMGAIQTHPGVFIYGNHYTNPFYNIPGFFSDGIGETYQKGSYALARDSIINTASFS